MDAAEKQMKSEDALDKIIELAKSGCGEDQSALKRLEKYQKTVKNGFNYLQTNVKESTESYNRLRNLTNQLTREDYFLKKQYEDYNKLEKKIYSISYEYIDKDGYMCLDIDTILDEVEYRLNVYEVLMNNLTLVGGSCIDFYQDETKNINTKYDASDSLLVEAALKKWKKFLKDDN